MIELFQITGSASFAARAALEEAGAEYLAIDVVPRRRDEAPGFSAVNPLARVPAMRDGEITVYETAAVLQYAAERFPEARLGPDTGDPSRGSYLRWLAWLGNTLHPAWTPVTSPGFLTDDEAAYAAIARKGREKLDVFGAYLEDELQGREWCLGGAFSVADVYLYMLVGWQSYTDGYRLGGDAVASHFDRVGARPAIARTRALDDLDDRLQRHHPELRGGRPV
jgi:glutathione S-transferase